MANITKNVWTEYNGKKFGAAYAEYAQVANTDVAGNSIKDTYATKEEMQSAMGDIESLLAAL